jgi:hypothetical protein
MSHVKVSFTLLEEGKKELVEDSKRIPCHMIFDVRFNFTRKAQFIAGGHITDLPTSLKYSSVVAWGSLAFLIIALNDLDILTANVSNAYLNAHIKKRVHTICGSDGPSFIGIIAVIIRALYNLKSSRAA